MRITKGPLQKILICPSSLPPLSCTALGVLPALYVGRLKSQQGKIETIKYMFLVLWLSRLLVLDSLCYAVD